MLPCYLPCLRHCAKCPGYKDAQRFLTLKIQDLDHRMSRGARQLTEKEWKVQHLRWVFKRKYARGLGVGALSFHARKGFRRKWGVCELVLEGTEVCSGKDVEKVFPSKGNYEGREAWGAWQSQRQADSLRGAAANEWWPADRLCWGHRAVLNWNHT